MMMLLKILFVFVSICCAQNTTGGPAKKGQKSMKNKQNVQKEDLIHSLEQTIRHETSRMQAFQSTVFGDEKTQIGQKDDQNPDVPSLINDKYVISKRTAVHQRYLYTIPVSIKKVDYLLQVALIDQKLTMFVVSIDHGDILCTFQLNLIFESKDLQIDFFSAPGNPTGKIAGVVFEPFGVKEGGNLYSIGLNYENSTFQEVSINSKKELDHTPKMIRELKQRGVHRVLTYDGNNEMQIHSNTLQGNETIELPDNQTVVEVVQQPMALLYHTKSYIAFIKQGRAQQSTAGKKGPPKNVNLIKQCKSTKFDIDQIVYDQLQPQVILALSKKQNLIQMFEAKGKGEQFICQVKGIMRFKDKFQMERLAIQQNTGTLFVTGTDDRFLRIPYDQSNVIASLLATSVSEILSSCVHKFDNAHSTRFSFDLVDKYILVNQITPKNEESLTVFESAYDPKIHGARTVGGKRKEADEPSIWAELLTPQFLQKAMVPLGFFIVIIYQFFCKSSKPARAQTTPAPTSKAARDKLINDKVSSLSRSMGNDRGRGNEDLSDCD